LIVADGTTLFGLWSTENVASGNDLIYNDAIITTEAVSVAPSIAVGVAVFGVSGAISTSTATSSAFGIDAGAGNDYVNNSGALNITSFANADAISGTFSLIGVSGAGTSAWDGGTTAEALAVGISGDGRGANVTTDRTIEIDSLGISILTHTVEEGVGGDDEIFNSAQIEVGAEAVTVSADVALAGIGVAAAISTSTARADAIAIDAGIGDDIITNSGNLIVDADADAVAVAVTIAPIGLSVAGGAVWDGGTTAEATAIGISGDRNGETITSDSGITILGGDFDIVNDSDSVIVGGADQILNSGLISVAADATSTSVGVSATAIGASAAIMTGTARAVTTGIAGDGGDDLVSNNGMVSAISTANANTVAVSAAVIGANFAADAFWDGGTTAEAIAQGIGGGAGNDIIANQAIISVLANANTTSTGVAANAIGAAGAITAATAKAKATALDGGDGDDTITNNAGLIATSNANAVGTSVAVSLVGFAGVDTSTTADAQTTGIEGGAGNDVVNNNNYVWSTAKATVTAAEISVGAVGAAMGVATQDNDTLATSNA
ncbi:MAG: hypothetical protein KAJ19_10295, partial [Gammaproteobacteria bacterium]|nr:hypothetical protein [Gammaproteobacteria bacterium]